MNDNTLFIDSVEIIITPNTVRFGTDVYQFKNVTGFGLVITRKIVPEWIIGSMYLVAGILLIMGNTVTSINGNFWGVFLAIIATILIFYNRHPITTYGLKIYLPCNEDKIFLSRDYNGIKQVIHKLYEFMEQDQEQNRQAIIKIDQRHARIGINYAKNINPHKDEQP